MASQSCKNGAMETRSVRSYRLRGSRITRSQASALERFWPAYGVEIPEGKLDLPALFPDSKKIIMEIGFGMGEATALIGRDFPNDGFLAVEVHFPGVGKLMARIEELGLKNIRIMETDVHPLFEEHLDDESLDGIHLFFPDPWPKKKHQKRRIVNAGFLKLIAPKIKTGGFIAIARAMATLWRMPPLNSPGWRLKASPSPTVSSISCASLSNSFFCSVSLVA